MTSGSEHQVEEARIMLSLLESVERDGEQTQRRLASELGVALGLINAYLKRCVTKGLMKVSEAPARRYAYYLTPQGFAEKARLTETSCERKTRSHQLSPKTRPYSACL